jgi:hypothetical protein
MLTDIHFVHSNFRPFSVSLCKHFASFICLIYLDDVIVLGRSFEDMATNLKKVYDRLLAAGLILKAKKSLPSHSNCQYPEHRSSVENQQLPDK